MFTTIKISAYNLHYKRGSESWQTLEIDTKAKTYVLDHLECGASYQGYLVGYNSIGQGDPSPIVEMKTTGSNPEIPTIQKMLELSSTFATINLHAWVAEGCPILSFTVEHRQRSTSKWSTLADHVPPQQRRLVVPDLKPGTKYYLKISAQTSSGPAVATYDFYTLTAEGGRISFYKVSSMFKI